MEDECGIDLLCYEQIPTEEEFDELNGSMEETSNRCQLAGRDVDCKYNSRLSLTLHLKL